MTKDSRPEVTVQPDKTAGNKPQPAKPPSDFVQGAVLFIAFIIFMALWMHFNLPD
jgi:hypothetical protein